jgi:iron complex transport system substrate-binding protein
MTANQTDEIKADKRLAKIPAIADGRMYLIPCVAHVWGNRTVEQPLTIFWAMNRIYPEIMTYDDLAEEIKYFYGHFFLYDLSDEQVAEIIG